jgi:peptidoglycan/xylan/chitin deacetylase (PgdA/CDA1 family)
LSPNFADVRRIKKHGYNEQAKNVPSIGPAFTRNFPTRGDLADLEDATIGSLSLGILYPTNINLVMKVRFILPGANFIIGCAGLRILWQRPEVSQEKVVCLTFDDGPNGIATIRVLEILRQHQIQATFFLIGKNIERNPVIARRIADEGHFIGNHSYGHENLLAFQSTGQITENLEKTNQLIIEITGHHPRYFRPPKGIMTTRLQQACEGLGMIPIGVHIFVNDSFLKNPAHIAKHILNKIKGGVSVIVLHDGFGTRNDPSRIVVTEALKLMICNLNNQGYRWGTLEDISAK